MNRNPDLLKTLLSIGVLRFGNFKLKSGLVSPIYIDLRCIINKPSVLKAVSDVIHAKIVSEEIPVDVVCGVPFTALPIASVLSVQHDIPMVLKRNEAKIHGTKKMIEGAWEKGLTKCVIIEDIITSGSSVMETAIALRKEGLIVTDCVVVLDRNQGGVENLVAHGIKAHSLFNIQQLLEACDSVEESTIDNALQYLKNNCKVSIPKILRLPFAERANVANLSVAKRLFSIIDSKKSNLCLAADVETSVELLNLASTLGPYICIFKTHVDALSDFSHDVIDKLLVLARHHNFLLFEDRKFADIGNTAKLQYTKGAFSISQWADIVTVHALPGDGIIKALKSAPDANARSCVLIAEMSSEGALTDSAYQEKVVEMAQAHRDFVMGFVCQDLSIGSDFVKMCPGVSVSVTGDGLGQQYKSPEDAVNMGADVIIVGRGIIGSKDPVEVAKMYRDRAYNEYLKACE